MGCIKIKSKKNDKKIYGFVNGVNMFKIVDL